jgi:hypothetical protein
MVAKHFFPPTIYSEIKAVGRAYSKKFGTMFTKLQTFGTGKLGSTLTYVVYNCIGNDTSLC